ncbi:MAG TPA: Uma2 family endonuclease [Gemmatimonadaceae bacterium]|nr:Uma2 family endonuclease [Gemmatimonadaceae bacterium]
MMTLPEARPHKLGDAELRRVFRAEHLMSMPALHQRRWTIDEVEKLAEEHVEPTQRYELVDGELLVTPSPTDRHQRIVGELFVLLREYVKRHRLGEVRLGPARARIANDARFEPDLFVVSAMDRQLPRAEDPVTPLLLVVKVLSPGSARHDRITKRRFFQSHGVPEYWVVDGESEAVEVWRPDNARAVLVDDRLSWRPAFDVPALEIDVPGFFAGVADSPPPEGEARG